MGYGLQKVSITGNGKYVACALLRYDGGIGGYLDFNLKKDLPSTTPWVWGFTDPEHMTKLLVITIYSL